MHAEYANDITEGKGANATAHEWADLTRYYDSFKPRPQAAEPSVSIHGSGNDDN